jgi:hypothetical protein
MGYYDKLYKTRFSELTYTKIEAGLWRFVSMDGGPSAVGKPYASKAKLLADLESYAASYGCEGADGYTAGFSTLETSQIVKRVIAETAGTIGTNGIQELDKTENGGVSTFNYVHSCIVMTAYNAVRALPGFSMTVNEFFKAVDEAGLAF